MSLFGKDILESRAALPGFSFINHPNAGNIKLNLVFCILLNMVVTVIKQFIPLMVFHPRKAGTKNIKIRYGK